MVHCFNIRKGFDCLTSPAVVDRYYSVLYITSWLKSLIRSAKLPILSIYRK